jgi:hypothetical protein
MADYIPTVQGSFNGIGEQKPTVYPIDATKAKTVKELGTLMNVLGIAMTKEFAEEHGLEHLVDWSRGTQG